MAKTWTKALGSAQEVGQSLQVAARGSSAHCHSEHVPACDRHGSQAFVDPSTLVHSRTTVMVWGIAGYNLAQLVRGHYLASKEPLVDLALPKH